MPGNNNPWAGELASRRKKNSVGRQTSEGKSPKCASPAPQQLEGKDIREALTSPQPPTERTLGRSSPAPLISRGEPKSPMIPLDKAVPTNYKPSVTSAETEESFTPSNPPCTPKQNSAKVKPGDNEAKQQPQGSKAAECEQKKLVKEEMAPARQERNAEEKSAPSKGETNFEREANGEDVKPSKKESDWLKESRKNLKPVVQLFKVAELPNAEVESPIEQLISKGVEDTSKGSKERVRCEEQKRKKSEEYLLVNFPADVRKNLRGIVLPEDQEKGTRGEAKGGGGGLRKGVGQEAGEYEEEDEGEWEWEEEEEEEAGKEKPDEEATGKANITIDGSLVKIDRSKVDWSDDEFEEEEEEKPKAIPAPPPPPPAPPAPPPPPPPPGLAPPKKAKSDRVEALKKRPTKRPDWNDLMQEIEKYRVKAGMLNKVVTNDRSKPMLSKSKVKGVFVYESEKDSKEADILKEISQGQKLRHVRCNDRSKPNLRGIKTFKRQLTKEEKDKKGFSFGEDALEEDLEDVTKIKDDLESTKQLLELEVRSKSLLEKDNKKLQAEIERLKDEFQKMQETGGQPAPEIMNSILSVRKDSVSKEGRRRKSSVATVVEVEEDMATDEEKPEKPAAPVKSEEVIEEMEELKEEVDEARKLAEEWEAKYKEMQRQMSLLEEGTPFDGAGEDGTGDKRTSQNFSEMEVTGDDWMQKREVQQLRAKLKNVKDKKEMIVRERFLLTERVDSLKDSIAVEYEARKKLKKDVKDMNAAFKEEMEDMELDEDAQNDLDDCYFENEDDLVINSHRKKKNEDDDMDEYADFGEDDDLEESVEEIIKNAEESEEMEVDPGEDLFNKLKEEVVEEDLDDISHEKQLEQLNKRVEEETEKVQTMRKSNFSVKAKIDILYDLLQTQKEKHYDLKQELNRMLSDIQ